MDQHDARFYLPAQPEAFRQTPIGSASKKPGSSEQQFVCTSCALLWLRAILRLGMRFCRSGASKLVHWALQLEEVHLYRRSVF